MLLLSACLAGLAGLVPGCAQTPGEVALQGPTMGTRFRVRVIAEEGARESIRGLVEERLVAVDRAMSTYRDDSEISRFNRLGAGESLVFSEETWAVLELAWLMREESGGAFDPTVGHLVDAWGFGAPGRDAEPMPPGEEDLTQLRRAVGAVELLPADRRLLKLHPGAAVDLSAIAKGWAVDRVSEDLTRAGHANHLVEIGGEVRTAGHSSAGGPWRIAIERPPTDAEASDGILPLGLQQVLEFTDGCLATSGDYRNYWERDGIRYSHTIDPRTGKPVEHALASASVFHENCASADAFATALMALGPRDGLRWADENGLAALLLVYRGNDLEELPSAAWRERFEDGEPARLHGAGDSTVDLLATPTPLQSEAFGLLRVGPLTARKYPVPGSVQP